MILLAMYIITCSGLAAQQQLYFPRAAVTDSIQLPKAMPLLARYVIANYRDASQETYLNTLFRLQIVAEDYAAANTTITDYRKIDKAGSPVFPELAGLQYELYARAKLDQAITKQSFAANFRKLFREAHNNLTDKAALHISTAFVPRSGASAFLQDLHQSLARQTGKDSISVDDAVALCKTYCLYQVYKVIEPLAAPLLAEEDARRYIIQDSILIQTKYGITLSAIVVRKKNITVPQPAALVFTIYAEPNNLYQAKTAAAYGYTGIVALTRGKGLSPDDVVPYEDEVKDVNAVIDWIIQQPWSNGKVGMYGGSYNGFSQWAATKHLHPALKTIVPYVAAIPGQGLPMENNVFLNANYGWAFYVSNNKYLDDKVYYDPKRWNTMPDRWYASGASYRKIDSIDGTPNKWLQRWLKHPDYDKYWQSMVPYQQDFARINIPVLTITGYYDDGQISALHYLKEHYKYNPNADHYLIIGPYDHFGAQRGGMPVLREYTVDPIALINTRDITFEWLDHILKNGKKPALLKDKINYEVMGANRWDHAPSLEKMSNEVLTLYLTDIKSGNYYQLSAEKPSGQGTLHQAINFADRQTSNNNDYYPYPIIKQELSDTSGLFFMSEPFKEAVSINGTFAGALKATINKKDMDIGVVLYEVMPDGRYFHLSYFLGRASYTKDMSKRELLTPGKVTTIPFDRTRMVSRQIGKGSRLLVVLNINRNSGAQVNYGTGKDVSDENMEDAQTPLQIQWHNDSFIKIPVWK